MRSPGSSSTASTSNALTAVRTDVLLGIDQVLVQWGTARPSANTPEPHEADRVEPTHVNTSSAASASDRLEELRAAHDATCPHCTTATAHARTVFGEGAPDAELMFVGEAPGAEEDRTGRPFVGPAGHKLEEMISAMGFDRADVYIANVLKSRPPSNRTPLEHEIEGCSPFLAAQVRIIQPKVIVTLGGPASKLLLETSKGITRLRGVWGLYRAGDLEVPVMPTFHPAYLLRNYTHEVRAQVWSDLCAVLSRLGRDLPGTPTPSHTTSGVG